jgi:hypothetical protein
MIIYYTKDFEKILKEPSRYIKISKFKLGESRSISNIEELKDLWNQGTSPTVGEYELEGTYKDSSLVLSIEIPNYDISSRDPDAYDILYVLYEDLTLRLTDSKLKLAFILSGGIHENLDGLLRFDPLYLEPNRSIIRIEDFNAQCSIALNQSQDLMFLEGIGLGKPKNIYTALEQNINSTGESLGYVSRNSYEAYLQEIRNQDDYRHLDTAYINKYGLKIY